MNTKKLVLIVACDISVNQKRYLSSVNCHFTHRNYHIYYA